MQNIEPKWLWKAVLCNRLPIPARFAAMALGRSVRGRGGLEVTQRNILHTFLT